MASGRPSGDLGGPRLGFHGLLRQFCVNMLQTHHVRSASLVFGCYIVYGAMTSCVMSWCCTYKDHVTFCYKKLVGTSFQALFALINSWFIQQVHPGHPRMCVGRDTPSTSPGWSLLPSSVIIVLALVNSTMSHRGLRYLNKTRE